MHWLRRRGFLIAVKLVNHPPHRVDLEFSDSAITHKHAHQTPDQNPSLNLNPDLDQDPKEDRVRLLIMDQGTITTVGTKTMVEVTIVQLDMDQLDQ